MNKKLDELATQIDDAVIVPDELRENPGGLSQEKIDRVKKSLEDAQASAAVWRARTSPGDYSVGGVLAGGAVASCSIRSCCALIRRRCGSDGAGSYRSPTSTLARSVSCR